MVGKTPINIKFKKFRNANDYLPIRKKYSAIHHIHEPYELCPIIPVRI
jgi:hypothetical protein